MVQTVTQYNYVTRARGHVNLNCWKCDQPGHYARDCTTPPPEKTGPEQTCWVCGQPGHMALACQLHPSRLRNIHGPACGNGPCTEACRMGDHHDCAWTWCTCVCHSIQSAQNRINEDGIARARAALRRR